MISEGEIPLTKIVRPSAEDFVNFEEFVESLEQDKSLQNYGLVKVIPPPKWKARKTNISTEFDHLSVNAPIEQNVQGKSGIYELLLIQKKSMKLNEYRKKVECFDALTNNKSIEEVEEMFWKNIAFSPPLYGADMAGSLFDSGTPWNLKELPGILSEGLKNPISGVNNPYLYVGSWKTMFGWHKEDLDLYSINYLHYGKPKFWYCLPPSESPKLEQFARSYFPEAFSKCKELLRHKTIMIHPYILKQKIPDLKIQKMIQYPGEFIITLGGAYHAGYNWGFNIAEAVNFATPRWLEILPHVRSCSCINDSVKVDKVELYANIMISPIYGKNPAIRKICFDNGVTKSKLYAKKLDQEEIESTETNDSREVKPARRTSQRYLEKQKMGSILNGEDNAFYPSTTKKMLQKSRASGRKNITKNVDLKEEEEDSEERIVKKSKKIKKLIGKIETKRLGPTGSARKDLAQRKRKGITAKKH